MIWCVDHDAQRRNLEIHALRCVGMDAKGYDSADSFWKDLQNECPELILMDAALPGVDPLALIKRIRQSSIAGEIPVIMQAQSSNELDVIRCLDSGADDCLRNPFGMMEMVSRVKAVLRRVQRAPIEDVYQAGGISLSLKERLVKVDQEPIQLSYKEFELLKVFMEHPGEVFTRQWLYERIWNGIYSEKNRTVDIHVQTLRKKLGTSGSLIESVKYIGYRMKKVP